MQASYYGDNPDNIAPSSTAGPRQTTPRPASSVAKPMSPQAAASRATCSRPKASPASTRACSEKPVVDPNATPVGSTGNASISGNTGSLSITDARPKLSVTLIDEDLATQRRQILVAHIASDTGLALDLTIFLTAQNVVFEQNHIPNHSTLKSGAVGFPIFGFRDEGSMASQTIDDQRQRLDTSLAGRKTMTDRFDALRALDDEVRGAWVAFSIARTLEPTLNVAEGCRSNGFNDHLGRLLDIQVEN